MQKSDCDAPLVQTQVTTVVIPGGKLLLGGGSQMTVTPSSGSTHVGSVVNSVTMVWHIISGALFPPGYAGKIRWIKSKDSI